MSQKTKINRKGESGATYDQCQTPLYALGPLFAAAPHLARASVWEPAAGARLLADALFARGCSVHPTDIATGTDFFTATPAPGNDNVIVTNPPFSLKYKWLAHCYELGIPFALLMPVDVMGAGTYQRLADKYYSEVILLDRRVNFKMPITGWDGDGAQFAVAWFTWGGLGVGRQITYGHIEVPDEFKPWRPVAGDVVRVVTRMKDVHSTLDGKHPHDGKVGTLLDAFECRDGADRRAEVQFAPDVCAKIKLRNLVRANHPSGL